MCDRFPLLQPLHCRLLGDVDAPPETNDLWSFSTFLQVVKELATDPRLPAKFLHRKRKSVQSHIQSSFLISDPLRSTVYRGSRSFFAVYPECYYEFYKSVNESVELP